MMAEERSCANCKFGGPYLHSGMYECSRPDEDGYIEAHLDKQVLELVYCDRWQPREK